MSALELICLALLLTGAIALLVVSIIALTLGQYVAAIQALLVTVVSLAVIHKRLK